MEHQTIFANLGLRTKDRSHLPAEWEVIRERFTELYSHQGLTLAKTAAVLEQEQAFFAT
jgi:hypothetical protein